MAVSDIPIRAHGDALRTRDLLPEPRNAQTSFLSRLQTFVRNDFGINEHDALGLILIPRTIDHRNAARDSDLRRSQADTAGCIHGFEHVFNQLVEFRTVEIRDVFSTLLQHWVAKFDDWVNHQKFFT
jgi:hypothetical protein